MSCRIRLILRTASAACIAAMLVGASFTAEASPPNRSAPPKSVQKPRFHSAFGMLKTPNGGSFSF